MAQLDRFLAVMVANNADSILLVESDVASLQKDGVPRPITRQPLSAQQLLMLLREIAPAGVADQLAEGAPAAFSYVNGEGSFSVAATHVAGRWQASIVPAVDPVTPDAVTHVGAANGNGIGSTAPARNGARNGAHDGTHDGTHDSARHEAQNGRGPTDPAVAESDESDESEQADDSSIAAVPVAAEGRFAGARSAEERTEAAHADMDELLRLLVDKGASDLHLRCGEAPLMRIHGEMVRLETYAAIDDDRMEPMLRSIMPGRTRQEFADNNDADFAYELEGLARFRCNAFRERRGAAGVFRVIPSEVVTVEQLGVSQEVQNLCYLSKGLVLVTGPTGSGKSTTLCALIDLVNRARTDHVITIEDPIEFVHKNKRCMITQRQVGQHTQSFKSALRAALREDPDIILVGELRDLETVSIAIETAETGHLVFATLHTSTAASTVDRIIDQFPADQQEQIRVMLSASLKSVIAQTLCRKIGGGRIAAREILLVNPAVSNLIREAKTFQIPSVIQTSRRLGMVTLNDALLELVNAKLVEPREAYVKAHDKTGLVMQLKGQGHDVSFVETDDAAAPRAARPRK